MLSLGRLAISVLGPVVLLGGGVALAAGCGSSFLGGETSDAAGGSDGSIVDAGVAGETDATTNPTSDAGSGGGPADGAGDGASAGSVQTVVPALMSPRGVAYQDGKVYIAEKGTSRVLAYDVATGATSVLFASQVGVDSISANADVIAWLTHVGGTDTLNVTSDRAVSRQANGNLGAPMATVQVAEDAILVGTGTPPAAGDVYQTTYGLTPFALNVADSYLDLAVVDNVVLSVHENTALVRSVAGSPPGMPDSVADSFCQPCTITAAAASTSEGFFAVSSETRSGVSLPPSIVTWLATDTTQVMYPPVLTQDAVDAVEGMIVAGDDLYIVQAAATGGLAVSRCTYKTGCDSSARTPVYTSSTSTFEGITTDGTNVYVSLDDGTSGSVVRIPGE